MATNEEQLKLYFVTWNVATKYPEQDLRQLLGLSHYASSKPLADLYVIGLQEVKSQPQNIVLDIIFEDPWTKAFRDVLKDFDYIKLRTQRLQGLVLNVFCLRKHLTHLRFIDTQYTRTGFGGMWGNKGAVSIRFNIYGVNICMMNTHLTPHDHLLTDRISDYNTIIREHSYNVPNTSNILYHDYVFWIGDLNFRLAEGLTAQDIDILVKKDLLDILLDKDQLKNVMANGDAFAELHEEKITFPPTYKYEFASQEFNFKRRPSWTDRILYKVNKDVYEDVKLNAVQRSYKSHSSYVQSDHKPVSGEFEIAIRPTIPDNGIEFNAITGWYMDEENAVSYKFLGNGKSCSGDWIGLYHEGFSSLDEYLVYEYIGRDYERHYVLAKAALTATLSNFVVEAQRRGIGAPTNQQAVELRAMGSAVPKLKRPTFSGKQEEWETFKGSFTAMFKNDPMLMPNLKLQHLISCLEGEAARRIANFQVTGANFDVVWQALCRRYDNGRLRLSTQLSLLVNMPAVAKRFIQEFTRLLDTTAQSMRALKSLNRPVDQWDDWFIQLTVSKLDTATREDWEKTLEGADEFPNYQQLVTFLENRIKSFETAYCNETPALTKGTQPSRKLKFVTAHLANTGATSNFGRAKGWSSTRPQSQAPCAVCQGSHYISNCPTLSQLSLAERKNSIQLLQLCVNCLRAHHTAGNCTSRYRCKKCQGAHHTLLHDDTSPRADGQFTPPSNNTPVPTKTDSTTVNAYATVFGRKMLLGTAMITLTGKKGDQINIRAIIDPCSEGSFITEHVAQSLRLSRCPVNITVAGVGGETTAQVKSAAILSLSSNSKPNFILSFSAAILPKLTSLLPRRRIERQTWKHFHDLALADPNFDEPAPVECILGADVYSVIILQGLRKGPVGAPIAQETELGWIITGPGDESSRTEHLHSFTTTIVSNAVVSTQLRQFWEIEQVPAEPHLTPEQQACEKHFAATHCRDETGRYVVRLPFRIQPNLYSSRVIATTRLLQVERRLQRDLPLRSTYNEFMSEYENLGHMTRVVDYGVGPAPNYIPHHAVVRTDTGKLRVVFDASQVVEDSSLNNHLHTGAKLLKDIAIILTLWRLFRYVFKADIVKMFRQIRVALEDTVWQHILWRASPNQVIADWKLLTVTYGTACAPYLANRVLQQLAKDEEQRYPLGAKILLRHTYVDDMYAGADTVGDTAHAQQELISILQSAGMVLDKWAANNQQLLSDTSAFSSEHTFEPENTVATLGLRWSPSTDEFSYNVHPPEYTNSITKRVILSEAARLYDPLGWLAPIVIRAKILIQHLWITGKDWNAVVDEETQHVWINFREQLPLLREIKISRWLGTIHTSSLELHGFSDASEKAYGATIYLVTTDGAVRQSTLLAAKSKVAPINTVSVPRLELCGAQLLAQLLVYYVKELDLATTPIHCWSDSQVVLAWLQGHPSRWKCFMANRVSEILTSLPNTSWKHVKTQDNPADLATRGLHRMNSKRITYGGMDPRGCSSPNHLSQKNKSSPRR